MQLAGEELTQARDRFAAGVASNLEVTQAQEAVASASEAYISSLYTHNLAKATLAAVARHRGDGGHEFSRRIAVMAEAKATDGGAQAGNGRRSGASAPSWWSCWS